MHALQRVATTVGRFSESPSARRFSHVMAGRRSLRPRQFISIARSQDDISRFR
jgi:hypothetical protein